MFTNVSKHDFMDAFKIRKDNFSYEGLDTLYDYLIDLEQDMDKETELDVIAICCDFAEYENLKEFQTDYGKEYKTIKDIENETQVTVKWVDTEELESDGKEEAIFEQVDGILIPGGFGDRGIEGKIIASRYARENNIPFFGICLGLQCAIIDFARNVCGLENANSTEFSPECKYPVIDLMLEQKNVESKGATMRLGSYVCKLKDGTKAYKSYNQEEINERHRHRFEVNNQYRREMEEYGLVVSGENPELDLVEIIEVKDHPWFVGVQFHPELKSRIVKAHPLFRNFIAAAVNKQKAEAKLTGNNSKTSVVHS